jgi:GxxExxY protein
MPLSPLRCGFIPNSGRAFSRVLTPHAYSTNLGARGLKSNTEVALPVVYRGVKLDIGYRIDLLVEDRVIIEVKSVDAIAPVHQAQIISYLKLSGRSLGLLINFNVAHPRDGIKRFVNGTGWKESAYR